MSSPAAPLQMIEGNSTGSRPNMGTHSMDEASTMAATDLTNPNQRRPLPPQIQRAASRSDQGSLFLGSGTMQLQAV
ncbi:hypothetical protein ACLOJK_004798 [Asimina triloba]